MKGNLRRSSAHLSTGFRRHAHAFGGVLSTVDVDQDSLVHGLGPFRVQSSFVLFRPSAAIGRPAEGLPAIRLRSVVNSLAASPTHSIYSWRRKPVCRGAPLSGKSRFRMGACRPEAGQVQPNGVSRPAGVWSGAIPIHCSRAGREKLRAGCGIPALPVSGRIPVLEGQRTFPGCGLLLPILPQAGRCRRASSGTRAASVRQERTVPPHSRLRSCSA